MSRKRQHSFTWKKCNEQKKNKHELIKLFVLVAQVYCFFRTLNARGEKKIVHLTLQYKALCLKQNSLCDSTL